MDNIEPLQQRSAWPFHNQTAQIKKAAKDCPRVSIIIPSYNQASYLEAAIRSVLCQDYPNVECLVLDGGSQDDSPKIIEHYRSALAYTRSEPDDGQAAAVNEGARRASGQILCFLNSDDMLAQGAVKKAVQALQEHPQAMLVYGHRILIDVQDRVGGWTHAPVFDHRTSLFSINSETAYWRREIFDELGGFNDSLRFALDLDFFCRIYARHPIFQINDYLGYYRFHPASKSENLQDVCEKESQEQWLAIFGQPLNPPPPTRPTLMERLKHFSHAARHPRIILLPYLARKIRLWMGDKDH